MTVDVDGHVCGGLGIEYDGIGISGAAFGNVGRATRLLNRHSRYRTDLLEHDVGHLFGNVLSLGVGHLIFVNGQIQGSRGERS